MKNAIILVIAIALSPFCHAQNVDLKAEEAKILKIIDDWEKIAASGEIDKLVYYFADDAIIMGPSHPIIKGKEAIKTMIEGTAVIPGFKMTWEKPYSITVANAGDMAYLLARNHISMKDTEGKAINQTNKAVLIWRKQADGEWRQSLVIFNEEAP